MDDSSSSSSETPTPLLDRISELSTVEKLLTDSLRHASSCIKSLNTPDRNEDRTGKFTDSAESFMGCLEQVSARLKRSIRALEEEEVPIVQKQVRYDVFSITPREQARMLQHNTLDE